MNIKRMVLSVFLLPLLLSGFLLPPAAPDAAVTTDIAPNAIKNTQGSASGSVAALAEQDQGGADDTPAAYVLFKTPGKKYIGFRTFTLPSVIRAKQISSALLQVNFKGPAATQQVWTWSIYNWKTGRWIKLGSSVNTAANSWNGLSFPIANMVPYVSGTNKVRVRIASSNASADAKLDFEGLQITYEPITPAPTVTATPTRTATSTPTCAAHDNAFECQVLFLLNAERTKRGLAPLTSNALLHTAARAHSNDMAQNNFFDHVGSDGSTFSERITDAGYDWSAAAENIAAGYSTPADVVEGWMNSTGHRNNILNANYVHIGIGYVYRSAAEWDHYWTTDFGKPW